MICLLAINDNGLNLNLADDSSRIVSEQTSNVDGKCFAKSEFYGIVAVIIILSVSAVISGVVAVVSHRKSKFLMQKQTGNGVSPVFLPVPSVRHGRPMPFGGIREQFIRLRYPTVSRGSSSTTTSETGSQKFSVAQPELNSTR